MTCPFRVSADSGIDALVHAIEAYVSLKANAMTEANALRAMQLISANLRTVCEEPRNEAAREAMMLGSTLAGLAFSNASVCLVHGMSRPIGVHFHVPHGMSNAMLLPAITRFSIPKAERKYADCARAMGLASVDVGDDAACGRLVQELVQLNVDLKVPTPKTFGIEEGKFMGLRQLMAEQALASGSPSNNPRVPTVEEIVHLYGEAYSPALPASDVGSRAGGHHPSSRKAPMMAAFEPTGPLGRIPETPKESREACVICQACVQMLLQG
eukprot:CAMPEP_0113820738 /NCGR_PEP_ID=MMETSP0328-20130328/1390_1 /TAXON_ID=39455 /ORGANISM="Alexandrium minutum" /LENGTH=268 /DNA_ID=CAMNT_0000788673 /DNA_START=23 /DNA_END=830 /DNA_ORIENTATION=+ /assembly_acc=CAM_ASM_000350